MSRTILLNRIDDACGTNYTRQLSDAVYYALLDTLELPERGRGGDRKRERVSLEDTADSASVEIYRTFVSQAAKRMPKGRSRPLIGVITASSRDPFEVADFYLSVFSQAGAEVVWLPLDKTFQRARYEQAMGLNGCARLSDIRAEHLSFYREAIYPVRTRRQQDYCRDTGRMQAQIARLQGIFFNGGDQSLTLAALTLPDGQPSPELRLIRERMLAGELIVGGTSAGTAVQAGGVFAGRPVPMLTNGHASAALTRGVFATPPPSQRCAANTPCEDGLMADDLTMLPTGGTGLFSLGLLDTHFSERDREARLAAFTLSAHQRFGFGVDEATAMLVKVNSPDGEGESSTQQTRNSLSAELDFDLHVIGRGGVFVVDTSVSNYRRASRMREDMNQQVEVAAMAHYLASGSSARYSHTQDSLDITLAGNSLQDMRTLSGLASGEWRDRLRQACGTTSLVDWQQFGYLFQVRASRADHFSQSEDAHGVSHCSYRHLPFVITYRN